MLEQLEAFLACAIPYLYHACRKDDFIVDSLVKLARITRREGTCSEFEEMIRKSYHVPRPAYLRMYENYTPWLSRNLSSAMERITAYLMRRYGTDRIRFEITKKTKWR